MERTGFPSVTTTDKPAMRRRWRVVDVVVAGVLGAAIGVLFWAWTLASEPIAAPFKLALPGAQGLVYSVWVLGGVLGGLVLRKPGAALAVEVLASMVEALLGTHWGLLTLVAGVVEGLGAELVFSLFAYRVWTLGTAWLAGAGAGLALGVSDLATWYGWSLGARFTSAYLVSAAVGGAVVTGTFAWYATRVLAQSGALNRFASGGSRSLV